MNTKRLAYVVLKAVLQKESRTGEIEQILEEKGIVLEDLQIREIAAFIKDNDLGYATPLGPKKYTVEPKPSAVEFVTHNSDASFDNQILLIYQDLKTRPERKDWLLPVLNRVGLDLTEPEIDDLVEYFKKHPDEVTCRAGKVNECELILRAGGIGLLNKTKGGFY